MSDTAVTTVTGLATRPNVNGDTTTIWVPLTTVYPSHSGCAEDFWQVVEGSIVAWDPGYGRTVDTDWSCQPTQLTSWWNANEVYNNIDLSVTKISMGPIVCPAAYTTATQSEFQPTDGLASTVVACCPSDYTYSAPYDRGVPGECYSTVSKGQVIKYVSYSTDNGTMETVSTTMNETSMIWAVHYNGWLFPQSSTSSDTAATTTGTASASASDSGSAGLSTGAKAGIGIGVSAGVLGIGAVIAALLMRRRRRRRELVPQSDIPSPAPETTGSGITSPYKDTPQAPSEVFGSLPKDNTRAELAETRKPIELP